MPSSPYINRFLQPDTIVPYPSNPQSWNRYSYVLNNPINFADPTGHCSLSGHWVSDADSACQWASSNQDSISGSGNGGFVQSDDKEKEKKEKSFRNMKPGDIITFEIIIDGKTTTYSYMLGLLDDHQTLGFWDLDAHSYVPYGVAATEVDLSNHWTVFRMTNPKSFSSYEVAGNGGTHLPLNEFDFYWTGGVDDNPAYVEISTKVDWENIPDHFVWSVLGPGAVAGAWMNAKPSVTPVNNAAFWPLTNYLAGLTYFVNDGAALERYPLIHLQPSLTERIFNPLQ